MRYIGRRATPIHAGDNIAGQHWLLDQLEQYTDLEAWEAFL
jgi:hypothetical protein